MTTQYQCPVCSSADLDLFFEMNSIPVHCNILLGSKEEAVKAPRGDMKLGFCRDCGHLYNYAFNPKLMVYTQAYENSLHFSPRFQQFAEDLATDLIARYNVRNKTVIDIGCGKGDFLKLMCDLGENRGYGFDTSYEPEIMANTNHERFEVIQDFYSEKYSNYNADFVSCRHVLEHIEFPKPFLNDVSIAIGNRPNAVIYFEVPNALWTLRDLGVWDLIYEHCSYFTPNSLARVFAMNGFTVKRLSEQYGGQFLGIDLMQSQGAPKAWWKDDVDLKEISKLVGSFGENYRMKVETWKKHFDRLHSENKRAVVWGGGSKGITFLNVMKNYAAIEVMVDINPRKHGMFVAGAGQKVVAPEFLRDYKPDAIIIMNPIYKEEIQSIAATMRLTSEILIA